MTGIQIPISFTTRVTVIKMRGNEPQIRASNNFRDDSKNGSERECNVETFISNEKNYANSGSVKTNVLFVGYELCVTILRERLINFLIENSRCMRVFLTR